MNFTTPRIGAKLHFKTATVTTSTGHHTPVIDLGGLALTSIQMSAAWTDATISIHGSVSSSSTSSQVPLFGSKVAGSIGSTIPVVATYITTDNRILAIDPRLTMGLQYVMLKSSANQASERDLVLGLS